MRILKDLRQLKSLIIVVQGFFNFFRNSNKLTDKFLKAGIRDYPSYVPYLKSHHCQYRHLRRKSLG